MADLAVPTLAIGDKAVRAGLGLEHVGKIFRAHGGLLLDDVVGPDDTGHHSAAKIGFIRGVNGRRVVALKLEIAAHTESCAGVLGDFFHARFNHVQHLDREGAHRALNLHHVGDDVGGLACVNHGDGHHACINRLLVAADDGLKRLHHLASHRHRVQAVVRKGSVATAAFDDDLELVAGGHHRPRAHGKFANLGARPVMHAEHRLHREFLEQPVFDHLAGAATAFFGGLENQVNRAIKIAVFGEVLGRCQQHGGMAIVPAGVHLARMLAGVREGVELLHRQGIHVGAQANCAGAGAAFDDANDARCAHATVNGNAPFGELFGHHVGGADLFKTQLGVSMDVAADGRNASGLGDDRVNDLHGGS